PRDRLRLSHSATHTTTTASHRRGRIRGLSRPCRRGYNGPRAPRVRGGAASGHRPWNFVLGDSLRGATSAPRYRSVCGALPRRAESPGLTNELIAPQSEQNGGTHVCCRERLGGLLRYYHRAA